MNSFALALSSVPARCQSCGEQGPCERSRGKQSWCKCPPKKLGGPYVAAPGVVVRAIYETDEQRAFREKCRLAGNALVEARDGLSQRFVRSGRYWRELPRGHAKRERLERSYATAKHALAKLQAVCLHENRSLFDSDCCDVCHTDLSGAQKAVRRG